MTTELSSRFLVRPEGRIAYDLHGEGPLVVLVPGMGDLRSSYRFLVPLLVRAGYRVAATDLRGHGGSDATFTAYGDLQTAADVSALIRELGGPAVIIGNSMGAGAAVIVAAEHPELVSGLVLVGPFVRNPPLGSFATAMFRVLMARPWAAAVWKAYLPSLYAGAKPADFAQYRAKVAEAMSRPGYARAFSLTTRTDHAPAEARLAAVAARALIVMGEKDPDFRDPRDEAEWIGRALGAQVVMVPDAGHYPQAQQSETTSAAIVGFLADVSRRA